ncbi:hypothetical protein SASPL_131468 [Salvia splendens]|uniref:Uncharacterized protein n=1 Tax=Salvia splendens TaxID=180675 RepID=A0A8X8XA41_SALSN|nr:hypothetical protein SASPL_131468 [Salvia splendens]
MAMHAGHILLDDDIHMIKFLVSGKVCTVEAYFGRLIGIWGHRLMKFLEYVRMTCRHISSHLCLAAPSRANFNHLYLTYVAVYCCWPNRLTTILYVCRIPISDGKLNMGTWQGIWLCEHRDAATPRRVVVTLNGI